MGGEAETVVDCRRVPLERYRVFETTELEVAREEVGRIFCSHRLELAQPRSRLQAVQTAARLDQLTLSYLDYGAAVRINPGELESFFLVQMPFSGRAEIRCGSQAIASVAGLAAVDIPTEPLSMQWEEGSRQLILKVERRTLECHLEGLLHRPLRVPVRFELGLDLTSPTGRSWFELVRLLWRELEHEEGLIHRHPLAGAELEQLLMTGLLLTQPSNYSAALHEDRPPPAPPRAVRRTVELIDAHPELPHTVGELARAASVSVRSLQDAFHRTLGVSPTAYLRQVRLERAHADLSAIAAGRESTTVTEVAYRWGFTHLGRFSEAYRRRFGQSPSTTQRGCFGAGPHHVSGAGRPTTRS